MAELSAEEHKQDWVSKIIFVDDDQIQHLVNRTIIRNISKSIQILSYMNPIEALKDLKEGVIQPDVLFLDINMPEMSGWDFLENLEDVELQLDIHMLTSSIDMTDYKRARQFQQVKGFLVKPLSADTVRSILSISA